MLSKSTRLALTSACALALVASAAAASDNPVELRLAHWVPPTHPIQTEGMVQWAESINEASGGSITITLYPGQQLGQANDHYDMARDGIADIAFVNPGYQPGRFPIISAGELPFLVTNAKGGSAAIDAWYRQYAEEEMSDVKVCLVHLHSPGTFHSRNPIRVPGDIAGMNVRPAHATMAAFISELGGQNFQVSAPESRDALERGVAALKPQEVRAFLELHIEQAPSLVELGKSIGIGIAIPGNFRFPDVRITGVYGHVGTPRRFRRDAVLAATEFAHRLDAIWKRLEEEGTPMAMTLGRFHTNIEAHGLTTVPGELFLSIDIRAYDPDVLASLEAALYEIVEEIQVRHGVSIHLGQRASAPIARCAAGIVESFTRGAETLGLSAMHLLSPASHDAAAFAQAGVPIGMIFVRNENGSHNPQEQMDIDDFLDGVALLGWWLTENLAGDRANLPRFDEAPTS